MQRSKQQALMFLLGAVLVGGVLGFSADRVMAAKKGPWVQRANFYKELGITESQRNRMDSILDESICATEELVKPIKPAVDSLKKQARADWLAVLTPSQRTSLNAREVRERARRDSVGKVRAAERAAKEKDHPSTERTRRCGGGFRPMGPGPGAGGPDRRGPGGPFFP